MPKYRAFVLDDRGHVLVPEVIEVADDDAAISVARGLGHGHNVELWLGDKMIASIKKDEMARWEEAE